MRLLRYGASGVELPAVLDDDDTAFDARPVTADFDGAFLGGDGIPRLREALDARALPHLDLAGQRLGPPIARPPAVVCIGMNYAAHAAESNSAPPDRPVVFFKHPGCVVGPGDDIELPRHSLKTDWEVELAVVIGRAARGVAAADALDHVFGYSVVNDISARDQRRSGQWFFSKGQDTYAPFGPVLVTATELGDPQDVSLRLRVNGETKQDSNSRHMLFKVADLIADISSGMTLEPGDVIATGSPAGVGAGMTPPQFLRPGDTVEAEIDGIGVLRNFVVDAETRLAATPAEAAATRPYGPNG